VLANLSTSTERTVATKTPWSDDPVIGTLADQTYQGRVVVEMWSGGAITAVSVPGAFQTLLQKAMDRVTAAIGSVDPPSN
jgi:hypothetical protein